MTQFILLVAAFLILLNKIYRAEDRIDALEKRIKGGVTAPAPVPQVANVSTPQAPVAVAVAQPTPAPVNTEERWGRFLGIAGVVAVILGISFFLRYAFANNLIGVTGRVIIGIVSGILFISIGQYVREKYRTYSYILTGCGIGILYLTTFAAFAFYHLISSPVAYGLLIGVSALAVVLSIVDSAVVLATIGVVGGFLTPIFMTVTNASLPQVLTYVLILDLGVMAIAYAYKWRKLMATAFAGTWIMVFICFTSLYQQSTDRLIMVVFLTLYFAVFLISSIAHHVLRKENSDSTDLLIIIANAFGYTVVTYSLLIEIIKNYMGFFMVIMALIYFAVALLSFKTNKENKLLNMFLPAMAALFLTLAIPAQFDGPWISLAWFLEAIILYVLDYNLKGKNLYAYGAIVFLVSAMYTFVYYADRFERSVSFRFLFNERFFVFLAGIITAYILSAVIYYAVKRGMDIQQSVKSLVGFYFIIAQVATIFIFSSEIYQLYNSKISTQANAINTEISEIQSNYYSNNSYGSNTNMTEAEVQKYQQLLQEKNQELSNLTRKNNNQRNTAVDIFWIVYALLMIAIGFAAKAKLFRMTGLVLMGITAVKIFVDVWELGPVYRIVTSLVFGIIALIASFIYAKYKDKLKSTLVGTMILLVTLGFSAPNGVFAATDKEIIDASPYRVEVGSGSMVQGRPTRLVVPLEVQEKTDMSDLRLFTGIGGQVPYTLNYSSYSDTAKVVDLNVQNISQRNGHLEFTLDNKNESLLTHSSVNFKIYADSPEAQLNFRYIVKVYASDVSLSLDSSNWRELTLSDKPQYIFNFYDALSKQSVSNDTVTYESSNSRFLKVVLIPFDQEKPGSNITFNNSLLNFKPKAVSLVGVVSQPALISGLKATNFSKDVKVVENSKDQTTEIYVDFPNKGVITDGLSITTTSSDFYRRVRVQVKNDQTSESKSYPSFVVNHSGVWTDVGELDSHVYSFSKGDGVKLENFLINYPTVKASHYKIIIENQDNQPLTLGTSVTFSSPAAVLTFVPRSSSLFYLYFGADLNAPVYDIDAVLQNTSLKPADISTVNVSGVTSNPEYKPKVVVVPFSEKYPWILNLTLGLLVVFIAVLITLYVRKVNRTN